MAHYMVTERQTVVAKFIVEGSSEDEAHDRFMDSHESVREWDTDVKDSEGPYITLIEGEVPPSPQLPTEIEKAGAAIVEEIEGFDLVCEASGETDTGEVWALLHSIRDRLRPFLSEAEIARLDKAKQDHADSLADDTEHQMLRSEPEAA